MTCNAPDPNRLAPSAAPGLSDPLPRRPKPDSSSRLKRAGKRARPSDSSARQPTKAARSSKPPRPKSESKREPKREPKSEPHFNISSTPSPPNASSSNAANVGADGGYRWWDNDDPANNPSAADDNSASKFKWSTLSHNAVMFPPEYEPHEIPLYYKGKPVPLSAKSEEIATFYAAKLDTDYTNKDTFNRNFFEDFRLSLKGTPAYEIVLDLKHCDFKRIYNHLEAKKAEKKEVPASERKRIRELEADRCKKYTVALVDGREEKVGNFRVEPPGLFLGRGEHPKMGRVKARIYPEDITVNIGENEEAPPCPMPDHKWGLVVHKRDVTWLCGWKDSITGGSKYVWLAAGSAFKGMSDHAKFEKARKLGEHIERIRRDYREGWKSRGKEVRQRSVAMYLIDKLALRVGNEKGEEEADTVGCCSLRVEHVKFEPPRTVVFDFLGKDSIRYFNSVEVEKPVFDSLKLFVRSKQPSDEIFHRLTVTGLNDYLKSLMDGLSAKVFRTFNASHTLDRLLQGTQVDDDVNNQMVFYNQQNKEVAILCNHQRTLPKAHESQMGKLRSRKDEATEWLEELRKGRRELMARNLETVEVTQYVAEKPKLSDDMDEKARAAERKRAADAPRLKTIKTKKLSQLDGAIKQVSERLKKLKADMLVKEELKTVALGTSKINYLDPRITVAWCKKHNVPIEKVFPKTLLVKFAWAMEASEEFRF